MTRTLSFVALMAAAPALADNVTNTGPTYLPANGTAIRNLVTGAGGGVPFRWYVTTLKGGRSYCVDLVNDSTTDPASIGVVSPAFFGANGSSPFTPVWVDTEFQSPQTAMLASGLMTSDAGAERWCNTMTAADNTDVIVFIRVNTSFTAAAQSVSFRISIVETTLYAPWFYTDNNYEAFTQVQNTTSVATAFTITHYAYVPASGGSTSRLGNAVTFTLPAFGSTFISAKGGAGMGPGGTGGIKITCTGPPGALTANVTSVNVTGVGLTHSFNMAFHSPYPPQGLGSN